MPETVEKQESDAISDFFNRWQERAERIEEKELSQKECRKICRSFHHEYTTLMMGQPLALIEWDAEHEFASVESELQIALSTAQSRYEKNVGSKYERLLEKVNVFMGNIFPR